MKYYNGLSPSKKDKNNLEQAQNYFVELLSLYLHRIFIYNAA